MQTIGLNATGAQSKNRRVIASKSFISSIHRKTDWNRMCLNCVSAIFLHVWLIDIEYNSDWNDAYRRIINMSVCVCA